MIQSGVYIITNVKSNKVYIGSTIDFEGRWAEHRRTLCKGIHHNLYLQRSWSKYGECAFEFGILEYVDNLSDLIKAEQFWMDTYREEGKELYNFGMAADCPWRGCSMPEETRRNISKSLTGRKLSKEHKHRISKSTKGQKNHAKTYPAFIHKETGEVIPAGFNLSALCRELGIDRQGLNAVIHGREPSYYGWILADSD